MSSNEDRIGVNTLSSISRRFIMPVMWDPPTPEEVRRNRERKAQEWNENTAAGLVAITSDETGEWSRADRFSYPERWVTLRSWDRYVGALAALKAAEADLA